jgi:ABC-2 type transport system permease protein
MSGKVWCRAVAWELRRSLRGRGARIVLGALFAAGLFSLAVGERFWRAQREEIARLPAQYEAQMERLAHRYHRGGEAGYWAYYTASPTWQQPHPLAAMAWGVRDVAPMVTWVRLLGLEPQLYESPMGNPRLQALGGFDLAFVLGLLAPCALLLLSHDVLSRDASRGALRLLAVHAGGLAPVLWARVTAALLLVLATCTLLWLAALVWPGLDVRPTWDSAIWLGSAALHLLFWAAFAAVIASYARSPAASLAAALGGWVFLVVLMPALVNLALSASFPVPEGLELTVRQRQAMHETWDQPRQPNFARFLRLHPEWPHVKNVPEDFTWTWYYAMHELADHAVSELAAKYAQRLRERRVWTERLSWLCPPVRLQLRLCAIARTDLESHLLHLERVRTYHHQLKLHFFPLIAADQTLLPADTAHFPRFSDSSPPSLPLPASTPLILLPLAALFLVRPARLLAA